MSVQKITVHVERDLLKRAREQTGKGVTATIREGLELVAAGQVYESAARPPRQGRVHRSTSRSASQGPAVIAIDTSSLIAYLSGQGGLDVEATGARARSTGKPSCRPSCCPSSLSDPRLRSDVKDLLVALPMLGGSLDGYWERAGLLRAKTIARNGKRRSPMCSSHKRAWITTWSWSRAIRTSPPWLSWPGCDASAIADAGGASRRSGAIEPAESFGASTGRGHAAAQDDAANPGCRCRMLHPPALERNLDLSAVRALARSASHHAGAIAPARSSHPVVNAGKPLRSETGQLTAFCSPSTF